MKMKYIFVLFSLVLTSITFGQLDQTVYDWDEVVDADPDTVYAISLRKSKLDSIPTKLYEFKNLVYLNLEKNNLKDLPDEFTVFSNLKTLDLGKNEFTVFPISICQLGELKILRLHMNEIAYLPVCIGSLNQLEELDLFKNPIRKLPEELTQLKRLKLLELRSIKFSPDFQQKWERALPNTKIMFDPPCDCMK